MLGRPNTATTILSDDWTRGTSPRPLINLAGQPTDPCGRAGFEPRTWPSRLGHLAGRSALDIPGSVCHFTLAYPPVVPLQLDPSSLIDTITLGSTAYVSTTWGFALVSDTFLEDLGLHQRWKHVSEFV
ncbi:hypothetical protein PGT21_029154 [Puccinia graminis f. sp. tritici]|uniref:Uncharacterized protein n=1 Tax=Puccinia graminis f. sp. tritici TaxID=56615 RepID=A0A5B0QC21_PUCGR|nr:hypothetical protein PGT21_029154 [Puccinia graminis f. sp. tritici]